MLGGFSLFDETFSDRLENRVFVVVLLDDELELMVEVAVVMVFLAVAVVHAVEAVAVEAVAVEAVVMAAVAVETVTGMVDGAAAVLAVSTTVGVVWVIAAHATAFVLQAMVEFVILVGKVTLGIGEESSACPMEASSFESVHCSPSAPVSVMLAALERKDWSRLKRSMLLKNSE